MASWASSPASRKTMLANRRKDTSPELRIRRELHARGHRFRVDFAPVNPRRRVDIVFTRVRLAVFVDGCFWHRCPSHYVEPKSNAEYWRPKILRNTQRDAEVGEELKGAGWDVLRIWEHNPSRRQSLR